MSTRPAWLDELSTGIATIPPDLFNVRLATRWGDPDERTRTSAVLVLFSSDADGGPQLLVTERSRSMRSHPGQLSFPGGAIDAGESPEEAAFRETAEEIGLRAEEVELLGRLPDLYLPVSNFHVTPVVGWWPQPRPLAPVSPEEVESVQVVPLTHLNQPARRVMVRAPRNPGITMPGFIVGPEADLLLWGFTGGIVLTFLGFLGWLAEVPNPPVVELPAYMLRGREAGRA